MSRGKRRFDVYGPAYDGPATAPIRIWGTRRLLALARLLPLIESIEVHLLATGLPSFWMVRMGDMAFTLGLSGWTTNDWSSGSALDLLQPPRAPSPELIARVARVDEDRAGPRRCRTIQADAAKPTRFSSPAPCVNWRRRGSLIYDIATGCYRYRQIMSQPLGESQLGPEDGELAAARELIDREESSNWSIDRTARISPA